MKQLSTLIIIFVLALAIFVLVPALLNQPFGPNPNLKNADVLDLFTPMALIPLYFLLLYFGGSQKPGLATLIIFLVFAALWVLGQGMHLAANSIGHWLSEESGGAAYHVAYYYDEVLSHYLWHLGTILLSALLAYHSWKYAFEGAASSLVAEVLAGIFYGLVIFMMGIEGGTVAMMFPFAILAAAAGLVLGWGKFKQRPVLTFFLVGYALAALIFAGWWIYWKGFPQFSELGWI